MKTVYSIDPATGRYLGEATADESPLEPGHFLIPANSVEEQPPQTGTGSFARWSFEALNWEVLALPEVSAEPEEQTQFDP